jgi:glycosyltransferase involved in cell wall biosynthesis
VTRTLLVHHFGPDPATVGGMASVIRVLVDHDVGGEHVDSHATWRPREPRATARLFAASARVLLRIPAGEVAHVHLSERGSFLREGALLALARRRGLVTVATIHGASFAPFAQRHPRLVRTVLRHAQLITCLDPETRDLVQRLVPRGHCEVVPNPVVVPARFPPADGTDELVLFAGEIGLRKGADILCRAWPLVAAQRPHAHCLIVGPITDYAPPPTARLEVQSPVYPPEMPHLLQRARVIALPARAEAMPMILTEAMSLARPFVSTPVGAIPELARAGGMLVPVGDHTALAQRLTELLADPALARAIGERGRAHCLQTRSVQVIDARLRELYSVAGQRR